MKVASYMGRAAEAQPSLAMQLSVLSAPALRHATAVQKVKAGCEVTYTQQSRPICTQLDVLGHPQAKRRPGADPERTLDV